MSIPHRRAQILLCAHLTFIVVPACVIAQPRTLSEVLAYAREHAPRVEARQAERDRVRAEARARGFWLPQPPSLGGEWTDRERAEGGRTDDRVLEGSLALEPFGQGVFRARAASAERRLDLSEVDARARSWAAGVAWRYYEYLRWRWMHERTLRQADVTRRIAEAVQRRFEAGDVSGLELDLARVEAAEGRRRVFESERALRVAQEMMAAAIGWPAQSPLPEPDTLALVPAFPDTTQLLARALLERPDLLIARAALDRGRADSRLAVARLLPEAELGVFGGRDEGDDVHGLRASLTVPFLGPPLAERGARAAERRRLEAELRTAVRDAHADIAVARETVNLAFRQASLFLQEILPSVQEARRGYQNAYVAGQVDLTTVLLSEQRYREAETSFALALGTYIDALRDLEVASGLPVLSSYELSQEVER